MKTFHFCYTVTPSESYDKEGNIKMADFFINIRNQHSEIQAENLKEACQAFSEILSREWCIDLTKNGIKTATGMYRDTDEGAEQIGLVFKARTEIEFDYTYKMRNIQVWTSIREEFVPDFEKEGFKL
jgi:hypothetical protein|nr:MAG TPA: hypothetical protein [Caudoviricetes sp.]